MFKKLSISLTAIVFALALTCTSFGAFAMGPSEDGVYEVPIEMWHAEKERTSMGDSYIVHTALLTVDGDEKNAYNSSCQNNKRYAFLVLQGRLC